MSYVFFIALIALIYVLSRRNISELFQVSRFFLRSQTISYIFMAILFFPGTVLHEFSHALTAIVLLLRVRTVELFPHWEDDRLRLGSVLYEKKDPVRSFIVGIAPFFAGVAFFWLIAAFKLFPNHDPLTFFIVGYLIFAVSSTMFSSSQDLKDLFIALPLMLLLVGLLYIVFGLASFIRFLPALESFVNYLNLYLLFCLIIHIILLVALKIFNSFIKQ